MGFVKTNALGMLFAIGNDLNSWEDQSAAAKTNEDIKSVYRTREPWLSSEHESFRSYEVKAISAMPDRQMSEFMERAACLDLVIGTVK